MRLLWDLLGMKSRVNTRNFDQGARIICLGNITEMNELQNQRPKIS